VQEIVGSESDTEEDRLKAIDDEGERLMDDIVHTFPEIRDVRRRQAAFERKHYIDKGPVFCPGCSTWTPKMPREAKAFDREWLKIKERKKAELIRKATAGKVA
jgi:hypothetical protein